MKIDNRNSNLETRSTKRSKHSLSSFSSKKPLFESFLETYETKLDSIANLEQLEEDLEDLDALAKDLLLKRSVDSLNAYKTKLGSILKSISNNTHQTIPILAGSHSGNLKQLQLTQKLDESLLELQKNVMDSEKSNILLASTIDNIKGLLLDYVR